MRTPDVSHVSHGNALVADARALNALKAAAGNNAPQARREVARQLESLFMRELIKSMREATLKSGLLDGDQAQLGSDLLDQQLSLAMSGQSGGLAQAIERQLARSMGGAPMNGAADVPSTPSTFSLARGRAALRPVPVQAAPAAVRAGPLADDSPQAQFIARHSAAAQRVARESGIPAAFMLGQAGHESAWGRARMRCADGSDAHNLFGIKAGKGWSGRVAHVRTTEYVDGVPRRVIAKFRAYASYEESFRDYARLMTQQPRYAHAMRQRTPASWASALQRAGYATDPHYARKLTRAIASAAQVLA